MRSPDHIVEFVLPTNQEITSDTVSLYSSSRNFHENSMLIKDNIYIDTISNLINGNLSAIEERHLAWKHYLGRHKFYNHIGRMKYLNQILPLVIQRPDFQPIDVNKIKFDMNSYYRLAYSLQKVCFKVLKDKINGKLCHYDYTYYTPNETNVNVNNSTEFDCDTRAIINSIIGNIYDMIFKRVVSNNKRALYTSPFQEKIGDRSYSIQEALRALDLPVPVSGGRRKTRKNRN
jgi:hypothetical protein